MLNLTAIETTDYRSNVVEYCPFCKSPMTIVYGGTIVESTPGARPIKRRAPFAACDSKRCGFAVEIT